MSNPAFDMFRGNNTQPQGQMNFMQAVQQFKQNPLGFIVANKVNVNIPQWISNDPNAMLQYLVFTGQVSQNQVNAGYQNLNSAMARRWMN